MALVESAAIPERVLFYDRQCDLPADAESFKAADTGDAGGRSSAARGVLLAVLFGGLIWTAIIWALLWVG